MVATEAVRGKNEIEQGMEQIPESRVLTQPVGGCRDAAKVALLEDSTQTGARFEAAAGDRCQDLLV